MPYERRLRNETLCCNNNNTLVLVFIIVFLFLFTDFGRDFFETY